MVCRIVLSLVPYKLYPAQEVLYLLPYPDHGSALTSSSAADYSNLYSLIHPSHCLHELHHVSSPHEGR